MFCTVCELIGSFPVLRETKRSWKKRQSCVVISPPGQHFLWLSPTRSSALPPRGVTDTRYPFSPRKVSVVFVFFFVRRHGTDKNRILPLRAVTNILHDCSARLTLNNLLYSITHDRRPAHRPLSQREQINTEAELSENFICYHFILTLLGKFLLSRL